MSRTNTQDQDESIPRVLCPSCGAFMRLTQIKPIDGGGSLIAYDCTCGFDYQMPALSAKAATRRTG